MSFISMQTEVRGLVAKFPISYAPTIINRAYKRIRKSHLWSFNILEFAWASPAVVTSGTVTVTQGSASVAFDATAVAALDASVLTTPTSLVTQRQLRVGTSGLYNIITYNPSTGAATLDRLWFDLPGTNVGYQVYQVYYAAPVSDFLVLISVRNPQMFLDFDLTKTRDWLDRADPQRFQYTWPAFAIPWGRDTRVGSATLGFQLYELWGQPVQQFTYQCYGLREGADLVNPTDTLPLPLGEDMVIERAKGFVYEWAEANKGTTPRNQQPDWRYLISEAKYNYKEMLIDYKRQDKEFLNAFRLMNNPTAMARVYGHYNSISATAGSDW